MNDPIGYEEAKRQRQGQRATYEALLAAGAPEQLACVAALNPEVLQAIAPTYFGRPAHAPAIRIAAPHS